MENNNKEEWIKQLKAKLSDYQAPVDDGVWEGMATRLRQSMRVRRITVAAACVVALLGLAAGIFRLGTWSARSLEPVAAAGTQVRVITLPRETVSTDLANVTPVAIGKLRHRGATQPGEGLETSFESEANAVTPTPQTAMPITSANQPLAQAAPQTNPVETDNADNASGASWESIEAQLARQEGTGRRIRRYRSSGADRSADAGWAVAVNGTMAQKVDLPASAGSYNLMAGVDEMSDAVSSMANEYRGSGYIASGGLPFSSTENWLEYANKVGSEQLKNTLTSASVNYDYTHHRPMTFGVAVRKGIYGNLSVETGVTATWMRSDITAYDFRWVDGKYVPAQQTDGRRDLWYVGVPLKAGWSFFNRPWLTLYATAGGAVEKCVSAKFEGIKTLVKITPRDIPLQWSVNAALGAQWNLLPSLALFVDPGVSYFFDSKSSLSTFRKEHPFAFDLNLGLRVTL